MAVEGRKIRRLYPGGKRKAFNITYDDGIYQDIRFVELLNKYNIKGTFNLNSELIWQEFEWTHECGLKVKRLPAHVVVDLYQGHEVASHTLTHPYMYHLSEEAMMYEMGHDKLEDFFYTEEELALCQIVGHSYDLDVENMWEQMESIMKRVSEDPDIISMTNIELVRYLKAMRSVSITGDQIENHTSYDLWFEIDGKVQCVKAREK